MIGSISGFFDGISRIGKFAARWDDDVFDRINHRYSTVILLIFTVIVSTKQYVGEPIVCWCPALFTGSMADFAHQVCWISNTYYLPPGENPISKDEPREQVLVYYQWVPFILIAQAFLFQLTNLVWIALSGRNGVDVNRLVMMVAAAENVKTETRDRTIETVVQNIDTAIAYSYWRSDKPIHRFFNKLRQYICWIICGRGAGNYLTACYIICKLLYIGNTVGQIYLLNFLLGAEQMGIHFSMYGIHVLKLLAAGKDIGADSRIFPRITMCDFTIRQFSNLQDYTIECALPINLFSEKFFIFLWFWIVFVFFANVLSFLSWVWNVFSTNRVAYVKRYLKLLERAQKVKIDRTHIGCFADEYLRQDGIFYLRMLAANTNDVLTAQVISKLWMHYQRFHGDTEEYHKKHKRRDDPESGSPLTPLLPAEKLDRPSHPPPPQPRRRDKPHRPRPPSTLSTTEL